MTAIYPFIQPDRVQKTRTRAGRAACSCFAALALAVALTGCRGGPKAAARTEVAAPPPPPRHVVLDYNNGWYHTSNGRLTVRDIALSYERDSAMVAQLNKTRPSIIPSEGTMLYIPPSNNPERVRSVLLRIQGDPSLVPTTPWKQTMTALSPGESTTFVAPSTSETQPAVKSARAAAASKSVEARNSESKTAPLKTAGANKLVVSRRAVLSNPIEKRVDRPVAIEGGEVFASLKPKPIEAAVVPMTSGRAAASSRKTNTTTHAKSGSGKPFDWPLQGEVITEFKPGWTDNPSHGIEIAADEGSEIHSAAAGKVIWASALPGYGKMIIVDHGKGLATYYGYNREIFVKTGDRVEENQRIAAVGRPSKNARPRLYFKVSRDALPVDPEIYLP